MVIISCTLAACSIAGSAATAFERLANASSTNWRLPWVRSTSAKHSSSSTPRLPVGRPRAGDAQRLGNRIRRRRRRGGHALGRIDRQALGPANLDRRLFRSSPPRRRSSSRRGLAFVRRISRPPRIQPSAADRSRACRRTLAPRRSFARRHRLLARPLWRDQSDPSTRSAFERDDFIPTDAEIERIRREVEEESSVRAGQASFIVPHFPPFSEYRQTDCYESRKRSRKNLLALDFLPQ